MTNNIIFYVLINKPCLQSYLVHEYLAQFLHGFRKRNLHQIIVSVGYTRFLFPSGKRKNTKNTLLVINVQ